MNSPRFLNPKLSRLALAHACVLLAIPLAHSQQKDVSQPDVKTLAKYDANKNGRLDADELALMQRDEAKAASAASTNPNADRDAVLTLSPFEVKADNNGYMATTSASGTRLNSNLADLASPISVVTKQQLQDMAA